MNLKSKTKQDVINEMVELLDKNGILNNKNEFKKEILEREELSSTGFGNGIAIPHAKTSAVKIPRVAVGISKDGFDFDSVDGNKANLIFMIAAGDDDNDLHLKTLSHLAQNLMDDEFVKEILNSKSKKEIVQLLSR
ncbi:MAG: PTS sugar transporter subunit IIA [Intestinibacter bartlettii]